MNFPNLLQVRHLGEGRRSFQLVTKDYIFNNTTEEIYPLLNEMISAIEQYARGSLPAHKISACKQVVIELLTNGVKHSGVNSSLLTVEFNSSSIVISKTDRGNAFRLNERQDWPLSGFNKGDRIVIYNCDFYSLVAVVRSENMLHFEVEEYQVEKVHSSSLIPEHYGLFILAKFSSGLTYKYDSHSRTNTFSAIINPCT